MELNLSTFLQKVIEDTRSSAGFIADAEGRILVQQGDNKSIPVFDFDAKANQKVKISHNCIDIPIKKHNNLAILIAWLHLENGAYMPLMAKFERLERMLSLLVVEQYYVTHNTNSKPTKPSDKAKKLLIANVSHELRTPLNAVMGMLALLENTELDDHQWECVDVMRNSTLDLLVLINDILDISKLEAGELQLYPNTVSLLDCVESAHKILAQMAYDKGLEMKMNIDPKVPEFIIADPNRLKQMLKNLLSNAIKFTKPYANSTDNLLDLKNKVVKGEQREHILRKGLVETYVRLATQSEIDEFDLMGQPSPVKKKFSTMSLTPGLKKWDVVAPPEIDPVYIGDKVYLYFSVTDNGIGIAPENISKLFKSFSQVDDSSIKEHEGTGLGLAITSQLAKLMRGGISVKSTLGIGSTFYFVVPVRIHLKGKIHKQDIAKLRGKNFLIVDDNPANLMRLTSILDKWEVQYRECENSSRAMISYVNNPKFKFDLGLLDIIMPGMTGNELAVKIAASSTPFPLIALSSANQQISGVSPAFSAHINKPYHEEELLEVILSVMRQNDLISSSDDTDSEKILFSATPQKITVPEKEKKLKMLSKMKMEPRTDLKNKTVDKKHKIDAVRENEMLSKKVLRKKSAEAALNPNLSILIAEDKERNLNMLIKMLNSLGYTKIDTASNGEEAVLAVRNNKGDAFSDKKSNYDVILMDVVMPKKDGIQATREITSMFSDRRYRPKIIAVTARVTDDADHEYSSCGMDDVIFKPISQISDLAEKLNLVAMTKK